MVAAEIFKGIASFFGVAAKATAVDAQKFVTRLTPVARISMQKLNTAIRPGVGRSLRFAQNVNSQAVGVLGKKETLALNLGKQARGFQAFSTRRMREIGRQLDSAKARGVRPSPALQRQVQLLNRERLALRRIEQSSSRIENMLRQKRKTDIEPMVAKGSNSAQMVAAQSNQGAIDPDVLRQFELQEARLLQRLNTRDDITISLERDEFSAIEQVISLLVEEINNLRATIRAEREDPQNSMALQRRLNEAIVELNILQNVKQLSKKQRVSEDALRARSLQAYKSVSWLNSVEKQERAIIKRAA